MYRRDILERAWKNLAGIPSGYQALILKRIDQLTLDPRPKGAKKLYGQSYRVRQGSYRILYEVNDDDLLIRITAIRHRRQAYR